MRKIWNPRNFKGQVQQQLRLLSFAVLQCSFALEREGHLRFIVLLLSWCMTVMLYLGSTTEGTEQDHGHSILVQITAFDSNELDIVEENARRETEHKMRPAPW